MHVVFRESHGLEETDTPQDLGQSPADLVVLSFSDSDLGAFAAGYHRAKAHGFEPSVRLANLVALKHPLSVDTYAEQTLSGAKAVLVKLIGGESYWPYGLATLREMADRDGLALAILPADGRPDPRLDELSTLPVSTLRRLQHLCDAGGAVAAHAALAQLALAAGLYAGPVVGEKTVPDFGFYRPGAGVLRSFDPSGKPLVPVTFYRSYLTAADTDPVDAILNALEAGGSRPWGSSQTASRRLPPPSGCAANLPPCPGSHRQRHRLFRAGSDGRASPLNEPGCPVFQVALSTARRKDWAEAERGLSPADLAMHVVLPEVDGRIFGGVASFKQPGRKDPDLQYSRFAHRADAGRIAHVVDRVAAWHRLATLPARDKRLALVLSTYPGRDWNLAHAVGLDPLASVEGLLQTLAAQGHDMGAAPDIGKRLLAERIDWPLADYRKALETLPEALRDALFAAWGEPESDPDVQGDQTFAAIRTGNALIALQPERGEVKPATTITTIFPERRAMAMSPSTFGCAAGRCADSHGRAWHAGMAAGQGGGAVGDLLARGAARPPARHLPLHRQRPRRGGTGQAPRGGRHHRPPAAADGADHPARGHGPAGTSAGRIFHRRRAGPGPPRPADRGYPGRGARHRGGGRPWHSV